MGKKGYFEIALFLITIFLVLVVAFAFYTMTKDLEVQIESLSKTTELQDAEILELHGKNAQLQEEIKSLEIFDCTFGKFPELQDHYYNKTIEEALN
jgi:hypothetical protein